MNAEQLLTGTLMLFLFITVLWLPSWWLAARLDCRIGEKALIRLPLSIAIALVSFLTFVNISGSWLENSNLSLWIYLAMNLLFCILLLWRHRASMSVYHLWRRRKAWFWIIILAVVFGLPQWFHAASGNRWDEVASSAIHLTAANQFADGVFPPRHNAFPEISIKYHYGFTLLSGTINWLTGLSSNISIIQQTLIV